MSKIKYFSENLKVQSKTIILRLDLNVPINEKIIQDESRILSSLPFLKELIKKKAKIINYLKKNEHVMVQKFIPEIKFGDKRVFIIGGIIKGAIRRIPREGSIVSNIGQGGKAVETKLTKREINIAKIIAKKLKKNNIIFAGIDLIGNYLTGDINITSPTGLKNFKDLTGKDLAIDFWNHLESKLK